MKIAIHKNKGSFSERWIDYCEKENIPYKIVNAFDSDIIDQVKDCDAFMWHHHHAKFKDVLTAKRILFALEHAGIKVFPDFKTGWHFDDKVAQKYLLEAIDAPLVPSYVFYDKQEALEWAKNTNYPKVFKLKGGAGSSNVRLVKNYKENKRIINKAFRKGFSSTSLYNLIKDNFNLLINKKISLARFTRLLLASFYNRIFMLNLPREKGYAYYQDFIKSNNFDIRVIIIKNKAFSIKRLVRKNDFRASGSGNIVYDYKVIDIKCLKIAFDLNKKIKSQCIGYDFVFNEDGTPLLVEIGYGFDKKGYDPCQGYWDKNLKWHEGQFNPQAWMIETLLPND